MYCILYICSIIINASCDPRPKTDTTHHFYIIPLAPAAIHSRIPHRSLTGLPTCACLDKREDLSMIHIHPQQQQQRFFCLLLSPAVSSDYSRSQTAYLSPAQPQSYRPAANKENVCWRCGHNKCCRCLLFALYPLLSSAL